MSRAALALVLAAVLAGCAGPTEATNDPAALYGERTAEAEGGRRTLDLAPPPGDENAYFVYPALVTDITPRAGPTLPDGRRPVELVLEGALPDGCLVLHDARVERFGHLIDVAFEMRRPKGGACPSVIRPYRFYLPLPEPLALGPYTLRVNGNVRPFEVLPERPAARVR